MTSARRPSPRPLRAHRLWAVSLAAGDPALGALAMGSLTVASDLHVSGSTAAAAVPLAAGAACWALLAALFVARLVGDREAWLAQSRSPTALTGVAATAVLGVDLLQLGSTMAATIALAAASVVWAAVLWRVVVHWRGRTEGAHFMLAVSTESLAALAAELAGRTASGWLLGAAVALLVAGIVLYGAVVLRFHFRQLRHAHGDHWIAGGALAISALAAAGVTDAARHLAPGAQQGLAGLALVVWIAAMVWLPVLIASDAVWPRLRYHVARWSTVFPVAMYAACSFAVGAVLALGPVTAFARVWTWVSVAVWLVVAAAMLATPVTPARPLPRLPSAPR